MTVEFSGADAEVKVGRGLMTVEFSDVGAGDMVSVSIAANKINISDCDQRYCTINESGEVFSNNICGQIKRVTDMLELV